MAHRANALSILLEDLRSQSDLEATPDGLTWIESRISDTILDMIPSAEAIEALHSRARIARAVLQLLHDRRENPPSVTEMCVQVGARERTLFLSCVEAFGRPPGQLLLELRLNAVHRALVHPSNGASITRVAAHYGFSHFGRFAAIFSPIWRAALRYAGEIPGFSVTPRACAWGRWTLHRVADPKECLLHCAKMRVDESVRHFLAGRRRSAKQAIRSMP
jgi:AraC family ethanolamine operon transcriptional activator